LREKQDLGREEMLGWEIGGRREGWLFGESKINHYKVIYPLIIKVVAVIFLMEVNDRSCRNRKHQTKADHSKANIWRRSVKLMNRCLVLMC
jgi:hypothetical protein